MVYMGTDNTMNSRAVGTIAMGPRAYQGGTKWFSLLTGKILHRKENNVKVMPMPHGAIKQVNCMAKKSPNGLQIILCNNMEALTFADNNTTSPDRESTGVNTTPKPKIRFNTSPPTLILFPQFHMLFFHKSSNITSHHCSSKRSQTSK